MASANHRNDQPVTAAEAVLALGQLVADETAVHMEQAVLGCSLLNRSVAESLAERLRPEHFFIQAHSRIWETILWQLEQDEEPDMLSTPERLKQRGWLDGIGGVAYINTLINSVPTSSHWDHYLRFVTDAYLKRRLLHLCTDTMLGIRDDGQRPAAEFLDELQARASDLSQSNVRCSLEHIGGAAMELVEQIDRVREQGGQAVTGITTGIDGIDRMTLGLQRQDLVIVGGRASMGKTALSTALSLGAAGNGHTVAIFSLEMPPRQIAGRHITSLALLDWRRIQAGTLSWESPPGGDEESEMDRFIRAVTRLSEMPIYVDGTSDIGVSEIRSKCRTLKSRKGLDLVIVDYLQLMSVRGHRGNRNEELTVITRGLKALARDLDVPVVALCQLSRRPENRADKRPMLADLRESGAIEADADVVLGVYREAYYRREEEAVPDPEAIPVEAVDEGEVIFLKHRNGPTGTVRLGFLRRYAAFRDLEYRREEEP
jgi:replicative DNA helicase